MILKDQKLLEKDVICYMGRKRTQNEKYFLPASEELIKEDRVEGG